MRKKQAPTPNMLHGLLHICDDAVDRLQERRAHQLHRSVSVRVKQLLSLVLSEILVPGVFAYTGGVMVAVVPIEC